MSHRIHICRERLSACEEAALNLVLFPDFPDLKFVFPCSLSPGFLCYSPGIIDVLGHAIRDMQLIFAWAVGPPRMKSRLATPSPETHYTRGTYKTNDTVTLREVRSNKQAEKQ